MATRIKNETLLTGGEVFNCRGERSGGTVAQGGGWKKFNSLTEGKKEESMGMKEREQKREGRREQAKVRREKGGRTAGFGMLVRWHLGISPSIGLCGQSNDWCSLIVRLSQNATDVTWNVHTPIHAYITHFDPSSPFSQLSQEPQSRGVVMHLWGCVCLLTSLICFSVYLFLSSLHYILFICFARS